MDRTAPDTGNGDECLGTFPNDPNLDIPTQAGSSSAPQEPGEPLYYDSRESTASILDPQQSSFELSTEDFKKAAAAFAAYEQDYLKKDEADELLFEDHLAFKKRTEHFQRKKKRFEEEKYLHVGDEDPDPVVAGSASRKRSYYSINQEKERERRRVGEYNSFRAGIVARLDRNEPKQTDGHTSSKMRKINLDEAKFIGDLGEMSSVKQGEVGKNDPKHRAYGPQDSDIFQQSEENQKLPDPPTFTSKHRLHALAELVASVQKNGKRLGNGDKNLLLKQVREFTRKSEIRSDKKSGWTIKFMKQPLMNHQVITAGFMRHQEKSPDEPKGGLISDAMGLGKTVSCIANIIDGRPPRGGRCKTTLIVVKNAHLMAQWRSEIHKFCDTKCISRVMEFAASKMNVTNRPQDLMEDQDIILTTYSEVRASYPKDKPPANLDPRRDRKGHEAWWQDIFERKRGLLHRVHFRRVVLDEADEIKNHNSAVSIACCGLMAKFRWLMSGTPVANKPSEIYPYFKFLQVRHTGNLKVFKQNYCSQKDPDHPARLHASLSRFMIRRTYGDHLFGAPVVKLPRAKMHIIWCTLTPLEREIYRIVFDRFKQRINSAPDKKKLKENTVLALVLRLRQLAAHPFLIQNTIKYLEKEDLDKIKAAAAEQQRASHVGNGANIIEWRRKLPPLESQPGIEEKRLSSGGVFGAFVGITKFFKTLPNQDEPSSITEEALCDRCFQAPSEPQITECGHIYCKGCLASLYEVAVDLSEDEPCCEACDKPIRSPRPHAIPSQTASAASKKAKSNVMEDWIEMKGQVFASAKTLVFKAQVLNFLDENPSCKILVFTQFHDMIRILERICQGEKWACCKLYGKIPPKKRDAEVRRFITDPKVNIMIATMTCGGVGLNLTAASRVIVVDPWWNINLESQAFGRVFRIGQTAETHMVRICALGTIDAHLDKLKATKKNNVDKIITGSEVERSNLAELLSLFGPHDREDGKAFVVADDENVPDAYQPKHAEYDPQDTGPDGSSSDEAEEQDEDEDEYDFYL